MPCYAKKDWFQVFLKKIPNLTEFDVIEEMRKEKSDEELHELSEKELKEIFIKAIARLRMMKNPKKMKKDVKEIYI